MNRTGVDYADYSWNPVTGCFHKCGYCYAAGIARRFAARVLDDGTTIRGKACEEGEVHVLDAPKYRFLLRNTGKVKVAGIVTPYPYGFDPTFHRYRLADDSGPASVKKPSIVFVGDMADLFGEWVPSEWISAVFDACARAPWHKYLFLTKNPKRYSDIDYDNENYEISIGVNEITAVPPMMFGATATNNKELLVAYESQAEWLSIEPISEELYTDTYFCWGSMSRISDRRRWEWVVIGAETGNRAGKTIPRREWIEDIVQTCRFWKTPVFMKSNLAPVWGGELIQEYPEGLK
jgi:protein gp37